MLNVIQHDDNGGNALLGMIKSKYPNYHPVLAMVDLAHNPAIDDNFELQFQCHKTVAQYVQPTLKSIEVKQKVIDARRVVVSLFDNNTVYDAEVLEPGDTAYIDMVDDELSRL